MLLLLPACTASGGRVMPNGPPLPLPLALLTLRLPILYAGARSMPEALPTPEPECLGEPGRL